MDGTQHLPILELFAPTIIISRTSSGSFPKAFFGSTFTPIPPKQQKKYLKKLIKHEKIIWQRYTKPSFVFRLINRVLKGRTYKDILAKSAINYKGKMCSEWTLIIPWLNVKSIFNIYYRVDMFLHWQVGKKTRV